MTAEWWYRAQTTSWIQNTARYTQTSNSQMANSNTNTANSPHLNEDRSTVTDSYRREKLLLINHV